MVISVIYFLYSNIRIYNNSSCCSSSTTPYYRNTEKNDTIHSTNYSRYWSQQSLTNSLSDSKNILTFPHFCTFVYWADEHIKLNTSPHKYQSAKMTGNVLITL